MADYSGFARLERDGWTDGALARAYVDRFSPASDMAIPAILAALPKPGRVLDLCCGQGNVTAALADAGHDATGADFSPAMLGIAAERVPDGTFVEADAQDLPFGDGAFDAAVSNFGIIHVPDQPRALAEIARVLRRGGTAVLTAWCGPGASPVFALFYGAVRAHGAPGVGLPDSPDFHQFADPDRAVEMLGEAGLRLTDHSETACHWDVGTADDLFEIFRQGAPRAGYLLRNQPPEHLAAIREAIVAGAEEAFAHGDGLRVPVPAAVVVARRA